MSVDRNIILTGFMGTGKSTVGRILARRLKRRFIDTDALVEQLTGLSIPEIFQRHGEDYFRQQESTVIATLNRYPPGSLVVATGGGAVLKASNRCNLRRTGIIVLLTAPPEEILRRIDGKPGRPLMSGTSPAETMRALLQTREPYYRDCDLMVSTAGKTPSRVASEIMAWLSCNR